MRKLLFSSVVAISIAFVGTACTTVNTNDGAQEAKYKMVPAVYEAVVKHETKKVDGTANLNCLFGIFMWGADHFADRAALGENTFYKSAVDAAKDAAVYNACTAAKCDVLLATKYVVTVNDYFVFKKVECKVTGYPGKEIGLEKKVLGCPCQGSCQCMKMDKK